MKKVNFSQMRNEEFVTLSRRALETCGSFDNVALGIDSLISPLEAGRKTLDAALLKDKAFSVTPDIVEANRNAKRYFAAMRNYVQAHLVMEDPVVLAAAKTIDRVIEVYGRNFARESYSVTNGRLGNFIEELEQVEANKTAIEVLKAENWLLLIKGVYDEMGRLDQIRSEESTQKSSITTDVGREEIRKAVDNLFKYVEAMCLVSDNPEFELLAARLSHHAERNNLAVKQRLAQHGTPEEESTEPEFEVTGEFAPDDSEAETNTV